MHNYSFNILTGLSLQVGGVVFTAEIDEGARTVRIWQKGEPLNGEAGSLDAAIDTLVKRVRRAWPGLRLEEP